MSEGLKGLLKHTFIYGLATVLPRILTVALQPIYIEYLPDRVAFGNVSIVYAWIVLFNVVLAYGMETAFFRFYQNNDKSKVRGTALFSLLGSSLLFAVIGYLMLDPLAEVTSVAARYWRWVIGIITLDALAIIPFAILRARGKSVKYAWVKALNVIVFTGFTVWLLVLEPSAQGLTEDLVERVFIANFFASAVTLLLVIRPYFKTNQWNTKLWWKMVSYGFPILLAGLAFAVNETFDKVLLNWLLPLGEETAKEQVGIYTACYKLAIGMTLFTTAFRLGVEPFFFSKAQDKNAAITYAHITKGFVVLGGLALVIYTVLLDIAKIILVPEDTYWPALKIVPLVLFAYFFLGIYQSLSVWYKVQDKTRYGAYISILAAGLTLLLNILLIPEISYVASALATFSAYLLMMVMSYFWGKRHYSIPYQMRDLILYILTAAVLVSFHFYFVRPTLGIHTWQTYVAGSLSIIVYLLLIRFRESELIKQFTRPK